MSAELQVLEDFAPYVGEDFVLPGDESGEHAPVAFTLIEAKALKNYYPGAVREPFSLIFRVDSQAVFNQGHYLLTHPKVGERAIFLVPLGQSADGTSYCSTFN